MKTALSYIAGQILSHGLMALFWWLSGCPFTRGVFCVMVEFYAIAFGILAGDVIDRNRKGEG